MAGTTSRGYRYPSNADTPNIATDIQNLASDINTDVNTKMGLFLLNTTTFTSTCTIDGVFTSSFRNYKIILTAQIGASVSSGATMALRASGTTTSATNYNYAGMYVSSSSTFVGNASSNQTSWKMPWSYGGTGSSGIYGSVGNLTIDVFQPQLALQTCFNAQGEMPNTAGISGFAQYSGNHLLTSAYDGFTIVIAGSAVTNGIAKVYGYN